METLVDKAMTRKLCGILFFKETNNTVAQRSIFLHFKKLEETAETSTFL